MSESRVDMWHPDDGELHAFLDQADLQTAVRDHLVLCAECRARLQAARRVREQAERLLRTAAPANVVVPPFEQVVSAASRSKTARQVRL
ncbi:MAG TPA: hypothetical protein VD793_06400, partial [Gemmatimonadales bacterium]|nr:hypothetical protein [Gemmatimonadales bacterium]